MSIVQEWGRRDRLALITIALVVIASWGAFLLAADARYWDDWVASSDPLGLNHDVGLPWMGPVVQALFAIGPWTFKVLGLVAGIVVGWAAYYIAGRGFSLTPLERWLAAALIVALPLNTARAALAVLLTYSLSLAFFMVAWLLVVRKSPSEPGRARYIVAALLFFASFSTASLLLFLVVPAAHLLILVVREWGWSWRTVGRMLARFWYLAAAPIAFWVLRARFFPPSGLYEDYNTFISLSPPFSPATRGTALMLALVVCTFALVIVWTRLKNRMARASGVAVLLLAMACGGLAVLMRALAGPAAPPWVSPAWVAVTLLLVACAIALAVRGIRGIAGGEHAARAAELVPLVAGGLVLVAFGTLPYLVVDKLPSFADWEPRHQALIPIGIAVLAVAAWRSLGITGRFRRLLAAVLVGAFTLVSLWTTLTLVADWRKQTAIIEALRDSDLAEGAPTAVFADQAHTLNFADRTYSTFEYHGWLATAFGEKTRYGVDVTQVGEFLDADAGELEALGARYGYPDYVYSTDAVRIDIVPVPGADRWTLLFGGEAIEVVVTQIDDLEALR